MKALATIPDYEETNECGEQAQTELKFNEFGEEAQTELKFNLKAGNPVIEIARVGARFCIGSFILIMVHTRIPFITILSFHCSLYVNIDRKIFLLKTSNYVMNTNY